MKYRKKPVVIDALQWTGKNKREMFDFMTDYQCTDQYVSAEGKNFYIDHLGLEKFLLSLVIISRCSHSRPPC